MPDEFVKNEVCNDHREACDKLIDVRFDALNDMFESKLMAVDKARELAALVLSERLEKLNELRRMATDRDIQFVTKAEFNQQVLNIEHLRLSEAKLAGKADQADLNDLAGRSDRSFMVSLIGVGLSLISVLVVIIHMLITGGK